MAQTITDLKVGRVVKIGEEPYVITWNNFMRTAQRKPVMRTKLRNLKDGRALDKTFIAGEAFEIADVTKSTVQFLYKDADSAYFMETETFEQFQIPIEMLGEQVEFLQDGQETVVTKFESNPIGVELPPKVVLEVMDAPPGVRGDSAQGATKPATLSTGTVVQVPLFINIGDKIRVNTETGQYVERA